MALIQRHAPPTQHIYVSTGGVTEIYRLNSVLWGLPWDRVIVAFSKGYV